MEAEVGALTRGRADIGAVVTFTGLCRDEDGRLAALELEHYPGMAEAEIARVAAEAEARWPLLGLTIVHRSGRLEPGEQIVLVATASCHREAAFEAAAFLMDYLKTRAPFWKKEHLADGSCGEWVAAKGEDDAAAERWAAPASAGSGRTSSAEVATFSRRREKMAAERPDEGQTGPS
ncbi:MAG: molybdenum cofactor biosynthesis protein MoaE [Methylobacteriaceae bacterium]|nr:molybdenum cofactor biosynthesis protein MoaE [Methylobacteriaceae bacterium]